MAEVLPIDDWTEKYFNDLKEQIECHIEVYAEYNADIYTLRRLFFISLRQDLEEKGIKL